MDIEKKLEMLDRIYDIHTEFMEKQRRVCRERCANCCTVNVTMTTIEGIRMMSYIKKAADLDVRHITGKMTKNKRYLPQMTINRFAEICLAKDPIPEEENQPDWGICPFLSDNLCRVYDARPMACRNMISHTVCSETDMAEMDDFVLTMNTVFLQFIEHMDIPGSFSNMADILLFLNGDREEKQTEGEAEKTHLLKNIPMKMLLVPPQHQQRAMPIIQKLQQAIGS